VRGLDGPWRDKLVRFQAMRRSGERRRPRPGAGRGLTAAARIRLRRFRLRPPTCGSTRRVGYRPPQVSSSPAVAIGLAVQPRL